jgi:hypothetical protein
MRDAALPVFEIIPARSFHCGQMVRAMRREQKNAFLMLGVDVHQNLRTCFDASYMARAWLIDGKLAGLGGVFGSALSGTGYIWLALTEDATRHPVAAVREARRQVDGILATKASLVCTTLYGDAAARRFVSYLGFDLHMAGSDAERWVLRRASRLEQLFIEAA